jgi:hypothetical protein
LEDKVFGGNWVIYSGRGVVTIRKL